MADSLTATRPNAETTARLPSVQAARTFAALIDGAAELYGAAPAIVAENGTTLSFIDVRQAARRAARAFLATNIQPGDRIAIWAPNGPQWIIAAIGLQLVGGILVPLNTRFKGPEVGYILRLTQPTRLFTVARFLGNDYPAMLAREFGADAPPNTVLFDAPADAADSWDAFLRMGASVNEASLDARIAAVTPDHTGDILFTSGTTGAPKGAMHSQGQHLWMVQTIIRVNDLHQGDRQIVINPFFHSFGYRSGWVLGLMAGMVTYPIASFDPEATLALIQQARITVLMGSPLLFASLLDWPGRSQFDLSSLRVSQTGSSKVPVELLRRLRDDMGFDLVLTSFGQTETTAVISFNAPDADFQTMSTTVGVAVPGVELRIASHNGEVLVRGPNVMQGYYLDPAATARTIDADGWLHTGDVGRIGPDGNLRILDRLKDIVIVGGFNAYPAEIEIALLNHPSIQDVAVVGVPDARQGEVCGAVVVQQPGKTLTLDELAAWCRDRMANYKVPRHLALVDALPRTALGKVQKFLLRGLFTPEPPHDTGSTMTIARCRS